MRVLKIHLVYGEHEHDISGNPSLNPIFQRSVVVECDCEGGLSGHNAAEAWMKVRVQINKMRADWELQNEST